MEREVWMRGAMVLSILALVVLILVTPTLLGRRSSELASVPLLSIGMDRNESAFIVNLGAVVQAYQYDLVRMTLNGSDPAVNRTYQENETFGFHVWVPGNATFSVHVYLLDQLVDQRRNYFEYNVSVHHVRAGGGRDAASGAGAERPPSRDLGSPQPVPGQP